jgi:hypothetical protein
MAWAIFIAFDVLSLFLDLCLKIFDVCFIKVNDTDLGAFIGKQKRSSSANASGAAGNQCDFVF